MTIIYRQQQTPWPSDSGQIAWDNPITKDMVFAFSAKVGLRDNVGTRLAEAMGSGVTLATGANGPQLNFSGSQANRTCSFGIHQGLVGATAASWDILVYFSGANPTTHFFGQWDSSLMWLMQASSGSLVWVACDDSASARRRWDLSAAFPSAGWYRVTASWQGGANKVLYINRVNKTASLSAVNATATTMPSNSGEYLQLGKVSGGTSLNGSIAYARMWRRGLTENEVRSLQEHPYQIYKLPNQLYFGNASGGTNDTASGVTVESTASIIAGSATGTRFATASGVTVESTASMIAGTAEGAISATASGVTVESIASFIEGAATASGGADATASGVTVESTASIISGSATGTMSATADGVTLLSTATLLAGSASGDPLTNTLVYGKIHISISISI